MFTNLFTIKKVIVTKMGLTAPSLKLVSGKFVFIPTILNSKFTYFNCFTHHDTKRTCELVSNVDFKGIVGPQFLNVKGYFVAQNPLIIFEESTQADKFGIEHAEVLNSFAAKHLLIAPDQLDLSKYVEVVIKVSGTIC